MIWGVTPWPRKPPYTSKPGLLRAVPTKRTRGIMTLITEQLYVKYIWVKYHISLTWFYPDIETYGYFFRDFTNNHGNIMGTSPWHIKGYRCLDTVIIHNPPHRPTIRDDVGAILHHPSHRGIPDFINLYWGWFIIVFTTVYHGLPHYATTWTYLDQFGHRAPTKDQVMHLSLKNLQRLMRVETVEP